MIRTMGKRRDNKRSEIFSFIAIPPLVIRFDYHYTRKRKSSPSRSKSCRKKTASFTNFHKEWIKDIATCELNNMV
jgi:hypothetical protein